MSTSCQKAFSIQVLSSGGGPPFGPIQLDAATVNAMNIYAQFWGGANHFTGLLTYSNGAWFENQTVQPEYGLSIATLRSPALYFVVSDIFGIDAMVFTSDTLAINQAFPAGVWTNIGFSPGGFTPTNPAGWPFPGGPGGQITASWA